MARSGVRRLDKKTNHKIKAIPTLYKGVEYRSRTEARWAAFFESLDVPFVFEGVWFTTPEGGYLPDFMLWPASKRESFIEVKGPEPIARDYARARSVELTTRRKLRFLVGSVPTTAHRSGLLSRHWSMDNEVWVQGYWRPNGWTTRRRQQALDFANSLNF
jgi:hypothetical protein